MIRCIPQWKITLFGFLAFMAIVDVSKAYHYDTLGDYYGDAYEDLGEAPGRSSRSGKGFGVDNPLLQFKELLELERQEHLFELAKAKFPSLNRSQRLFAVNPSFKSFYDPSYKAEEGLEVESTEDGVDSESTGNGESSNDYDNRRKAAIGEAIESAFKGKSGGLYSNLPKKASAFPMSTSETLRQFYANYIGQERINDIYFTTIVAVSSALAVFAVIGAGFCYHRIRSNSKASADVEYPAYGISGHHGSRNGRSSGHNSPPGSGSLISSDRKLAQNAQMYHYQHQKQQMIAFDAATSGVDKRGDHSDNDSDDGDEGDYTVYECPGLAPAGEMEVRNPLFQDDPTPKASK